MNKKIIVFIIILSLLVPFLPSFDFVVRADSPSMSEDYVAFIDNNFYVDDDGFLKPKQFAPLYQRVNWVLADAGYVLKDPVSAIVDSLQSATNLQLLTKENVLEYGETINYDYSSLSQNIVNNSITYAEDNLTYYIYDFINVNNFFSSYNFQNYLLYGYNLNDYKSALISLCNNPDSVYFLQGLNGIFQGNLFDVNRSFFDENYLYLSQGDFNSYPSYPFQIFEAPDIYNSGPSLNGGLKFSDGLSNVTLSVNSVYKFYIDNSGHYTNYQYVFGYDLSSLVLNCGGRILPFNRIAYTSTNGTFFLTGGESFSIPVFRSANLVNSFFNGDASVYKFNSDLDLGQFGEDIDYSKLYDLISTTVQGNTGNVIDSINNVANKYLQQQLDLLHDINNALNDGNGQSWLRRIYGILDYNFPLTLNAFQDLIDAVQNISVSGGGGDFSEATQVLHDIDTKLGILIDEPFTDLTNDDWNSMKSRVQTKFPFCIFSDIVAISVILNRPPQQPDLNFVVPIMGTESENRVHIDLSPYEHARPYVHGVLIFVFIIGLLALSVKIFDHLKS